MVSHFVCQDADRRPFCSRISVQFFQEAVVINDIALVPDDGGIGVVNSILFPHLEILFPVNLVEHLINIGAGLISRGKIGTQRTGWCDETTISMLGHCPNAASKYKKRE